jgi:hypothetical protein
MLHHQGAIISGSFSTKDCRSNTPIQLGISLQRNFLHYTHQYIGRSTSVSLIKLTYCVAHQIKYNPGSMGKNRLICYTHIPLVEKLLAVRVQEEVDRDNIFLCSFPRAKLHDKWIQNLRKNIHLFYYYYYYLFTAVGFSPGGSSPYTSTHNTDGHINIHKNNNTKQTIHNYKTKYIQ